MSLDVYLYMDINQLKPEEDMATWNYKHIDVYYNFDDKAWVTDVFDANITHNLNKLADYVGIYKHLWRPDEIDIKYAKELIKPLKTGLKKLQSGSIEKFRTFEPENKWGVYENLVEFVKNYIKACKEYPDARVLVSR